MSLARLNVFRKKYIPMPAFVLFAVAAVSAAVHIVSECSDGFSDFVNRYISTVVRGIPAFITSAIPFSLAETVILSVPVILIVVLYACNRAVSVDAAKGFRFVAGMAAVLALLYSMFVFSTAVAYNGSSLADKLKLEERLVSAEELSTAAEYMIDGIERDIGLIGFNPDGSSSMPYSMEEMNRRLMDAYKKASYKYDFIPRLVSRVKPIATSELLTYTHISGIYTYFTGEANINVNFPDYTVPFTAAHELAHQRGFLPEDEANFIAFLVCAESDDPYIRYSGYLSMYQYVNSALYEADYRLFSEALRSLDRRAVREMTAYNDFFEQYRDNKAADISSAVNDNYLKFQGESAGEKSYGMVVDLAVAYVLSER